MSRGVDLHLHSTASDGGSSPAEVLDAAAVAGLAAVALTDHDTVSGIEEARVRAAELGIELCPGVEMTAYVGRAELHIIGLFIDCTESGVVDLLGELAREREARSGIIASRLRDIGIEITADEINALAAGVPGRMHVARALVERGYVSDIREAFKRYIGDNGPGYVEKRRLTPGEVIGAIREAGGISSLAHPGLSNRDELIPELARSGLDAIETYYSHHTSRQTKHYRRLAAKNGLLETGGSDYHGVFKALARIGEPHVPYELYERLRERVAAVRSGD